MQPDCVPAPLVITPVASGLLLPALTPSTRAERRNAKYVDTPKSKGEAMTVAAYKPRREKVVRINRFVSSYTRISPYTKVTGDEWQTFVVERYGGNVYA